MKNFFSSLFSVGGFFSIVVFSSIITLSFSRILLAEEQGGVSYAEPIEDPDPGCEGGGKAPCKRVFNQKSGLSIAYGRDESGNGICLAKCKFSLTDPDPNPVPFCSEDCKSSVERHCSDGQETLTVASYSGPPIPTVEVCDNWGSRNRTRLLDLCKNAANKPALSNFERICSSKGISVEEELN